LWACPRGTTLAGNGRAFAPSLKNSLCENVFARGSFIISRRQAVSAQIRTPQKTPSIKSQTPGKLQSPNFKAVSRAVWLLGFRISRVLGVWCLGFFILAPPRCVQDQGSVKTLASLFDRKLDRGIQCREKIDPGMRARIGGD